MATRTLTVVFTDIKGFTARTSQTSRASMLDMLRKHEELLAPIVASHGGSVVKTIGDAFLLSFESPTNAVLCGLRMQARLRSYNNDAPEPDRIEIRVAVNTGEVEVLNNDVFGETVNLASRIEGITDAGEVYFSEATYLAMNKAEVPTSQVGEFRLKGISEQVRVYRVVQDESLELYKQVIATPPPVSEGDRQPAIDDGALSNSLLLANEQLQQIAPLRRGDPVRWAAATVGLLLLVGAGYLSVREVQYRGDRNRAESLIRGGDWPAAYALLAALRGQRPADSRIVALLDDAATAETQELLAAARFARATERLQTLGATYPNLTSLDALRRQVRLEHATELFQSPNVSAITEAEQLFAALLEDYPRDLAVRYRFMVGLASNAVRPNRVYALSLARELVAEEAATFADDAQIAQLVQAAVHRVSFRGRYPELLSFVLDGYYDQLRPILLEGLGNLDQEVLRGNAHLMLDLRGELPPESEFQFFLAELLSKDLGTYRQLADQTFGYFEAVAASGGAPAEWLALVPDQAPLPPGLRNAGAAGDRTERVVAAVLADALREQLLAAAGSDETTTLARRTRAIVAARGLR